MAEQEHDQAHPPPARRACLTDLEAVLLALALFFMISGGARYLGNLIGLQTIAGWLLAATLPILYLVLAALALRSRYSLLARPQPAFPWLRAAGFCCLGLGGGVWIGATPWDSLTVFTSPAMQAVWCLGWVGVAGPIAEELFFRGALQPIIGRHSDVGTGIVLAAIAFTLAHLGLPGLWLWVGLGLCFGIAAWLGRSVWVAVAAHCGWNLGTVLLTILPGLHQESPWLLGAGILLILISFTSPPKASHELPAP